MNSRSLQPMNSQFLRPINARFLQQQGKRFAQQQDARQHSASGPTRVRSLFTRLAGIALASLLALSAWAQEDSARTFPNKPIRIIVGYAAGGGNDIVVRLIAPKL